MNVKIIAVLALICLGVAALAAAHEDGKHQAESAFAHLDADGNEEITEEEFAAAEAPHHRKRHHMGRPGMGDRPTAEQRASHHQALFETLDSNADGCISSVEFASLHEVRTALVKEHMFQRMDRDGNGVLTPDEFPPHHRDMPEE